MRTMVRPVTRWYVYIVECSDKTLYTGITKSLDQRIKKHNDGTAAKYTRGRGPITLRYYEIWQNRSEASKREAVIKKLSRKNKLALVNPAPKAITACY